MTILSHIKARGWEGGSTSRSPPSRINMYRIEGKFNICLFFKIWKKYWKKYFVQYHYMSHASMIIFKRLFIFFANLPFFCRWFPKTYQMLVTCITIKNLLPSPSFLRQPVIKPNVFLKRVKIKKPVSEEIFRTEKRV